jgi:hypothetical protein
VREGIRFELRCGACECHEPDILSRLCNCVGDAPGASENAGRADNLREVAGFYRNQSSLSQGRKIVNVVGRTEEQIRSGLNNTVNEINALFSIARTPRDTDQPADATGEEAKTETRARTPATGAQTTTTTQTQTQTPLNEADLERAIRALSKAKSDFAALAVARAGVVGDEDAQVKTAREQLLQTSSAVEAAINSAQLSQFRRVLFTEEVKEAQQVLKSQNLQSELGMRQIEAMSLGVHVPPPIFAKSVAQANALREWLLDRLDGSPRISDCQLRRDVKAIRVPASQQPQGLDNELVAAGDALAEAYERYVMDCVCLALNPPCAPCTDMGVLLACLEVDEEACEVVEICNLKRKFVITPTALRYWLPPIGILGELVEELCCTEPLCGDEDDTTSPSLSNFSLDDIKLGRRKPAIQRSIIRGLLRLCAPNQKREVPREIPQNQLRSDPAQDQVVARSSASTLGDSMRNLAARFVAPALNSQTFAPSRESFTADIDRTVRDTIATPEFRQGIVRGLKAELEQDAAAVAPSQEEFSAAVAEALKSDAVTKVIGDFISSTTAETPAPDESKITETASAAASAEIKKFKLEDAAKELREVKRIKTENTELKKTITALEKSLATLAERVKKVEGGS